MTTVASGPAEADRGALTVEETARWLGISDRQVYRLIAAKRIPAKNLGASGKARCLRVSRAWLERWMESADDLSDVAASALANGTLGG